MKNTVQYCGRFTLLQVTQFREYNSLDISVACMEKVSCIYCTTNILEEVEMTCSSSPATQVTYIPILFTKARKG